MAVTREDVLHVARLARLRLTDAEVERYTGQLNDILGHVAELAGLPVEGVEAVGGVAEGAAPEREDAPGADPIAGGPSSLAVAWENGFFTVPRLAAMEGIGDGGDSP
jgi:aspartyl-tRNA(Asn)/glutamyl-tRNA(Gln) amidotransferase subunit C